MPSRFQSLPRLAAGLLVVAGIVAGCSDSSGPRKATGMAGTWQVTTVALSDNGTGRGTCQLSPALTMTIDSSASSMDVSASGSHQLACSVGGSIGLTLMSAVTSIDLGAGPENAVVFTMTSSSNEFLVLAWPDMSGDSIGGTFLDYDNVGPTILTESTWNARRQ